MLITGQNVYHAINTVRIENHERALNPDALLVKAAQQKADDMVKRGYFAHRAPLDGKTAWAFVRALRGSPEVLGENLAKCFKTNEDLIAAWKRSSTHEANILYKGYTKTGIAIAHGPDCIYVVQFFAK